MSRTLLVIHGYASANDMIERHWPFWRQSGCDILGVGREDSEVRWPEKIQTVNIGADRYADKDNLCRRLVDTFRYCLTLPYDDFCILEADAINLGPIGAHTGGLLTNKVGAGSEGFKGNQYFHCPWWADRMTAEWIVEFGDVMLRDGDIEQGWPDRFLGWMFEKFNLPWTQVRAYSENTIEGEASIKRARKAVESGVKFVHGIKTAEVLAEVTCPGNYLDELALKHGTDKASNFHNYTEVYRRYLEPRRWKTKNVLEIGVLGGASLRMWHDYFPNAEITGVDIHERGFSASAPINFTFGNAHDPEFWRSQAQQPFRYDLIVDDGAHTSFGIIQAFEGAYPLLRPGGLYIIEDLHASYMPAYNRDGGPNAMDYFKARLDELNELGADQCGRPKPGARFDFINFHKSLIIIGKS